MKSKILLAFLLWLNGTLSAENKIGASVRLPAREKLHLYLFMGQSNMAGRGDIEDEDRTFHARVYAFATNEIWELALDPVHKDRAKGLGVGPALTFGKTMARENSKVTIGLVPCAVGGTPLSRWCKGGDLYERAVARAKLAMKDGTLKGILWHQGESDSGQEELATTYGDRLAKMIADIRADLNAPNLPVVVGELGEFLYQRSDPTKSRFAKNVNASLVELPNKVPNLACARSAGLKHKGDELHFDAASQREFGRRYAAEMIKLQARKN